MKKSLKKRVRAALAIITGLILIGLRAHSETIELTGSHAIFLSHAPEVAALIEKAAEAAK